MTAPSIAHAYWLACAKQPLLPLYSVNTAAEVLANFGPDELDEANDALQQMLEDQGLATDLDSLVVALDDIKGGSPEFWGGGYLLQADSGELFQLSLVNDTLGLLSFSLSETPTLISAPFSGMKFGAQALSYEDDTIQLTLTFYHPVELPENAGLPPQQFLDKDPARVKGQINIKGKTPKSYKVTGKKETCTVAGLKYEGYGDPLEVWTGKYSCRYADQNFAYIDNITVGIDDSGAVTVKYGDADADSMLLTNNILSFSLSNGAIFAGALLCTSTGVRSFAGAVLAEGQTRLVAGTATTRYAPSANVWLAVRGNLPTTRALGPAVEDTPVFCATNVDQQVSIGLQVVPQTPYPDLPVTYEDGSTGSIQVAPVRDSDVYMVPQGELVVYHALDANNVPLKTDASLKVGWLVSAAIDLLSMAETDYYQLRLTFADWTKYDTKGLRITLAQDDSVVPKFITLTAAGGAATCGAGTGGEKSPVKDFTKATTLVAATNTAQGIAKRAYRFELNGNSTTPDNSAGEHDGFLCVKLSFKASDGTTDKLPPRTVSIPLLVSINLPISIQPLLQLEGMTKFDASVYPGGNVQAGLGAIGGVQPYEWNALTAPPHSLKWTVDDGGTAYDLTGTLDTAVQLGTYPMPVTYQSDTTKVVSRLQTCNPVLKVVSPPSDPAQWGISPTIGASVVGGVVALLIAGGIYRKLNKNKVDEKGKAETSALLVNERVATVREITGNNIIENYKFLNEKIMLRPRDTADRLTKRINEVDGFIKDALRRCLEYSELAKKARNDGNAELADKFGELADAEKEVWDNWADARDDLDSNRDAASAGAEGGIPSDEE